MKRSVNSCRLAPPEPAASPQRAQAELVNLSTATRPAPSSPPLTASASSPGPSGSPLTPWSSSRTSAAPDEEFRLQFEAFTAFDKDEKKAAKALLDALILKHQARRWASAS